MKGDVGLPGPSGPVGPPGPQGVGKDGFPGKNNFDFLPSHWFFDEIFLNFS